MKRTPLKRSMKSLKRSPLPRASKPIARSGKPKAKRSKPRRVSVLRDQSFMDWLKTQFCVVCQYSYPGGYTMTKQITNTEPAHTGKTNGMRSKSADSTCIPLCSLHHSEIDGKLSTKITTKAAFAAKYGLDLAQIAATYYAAYLRTKEQSC